LGHRETVESEFTRQAESFRASPTLAAPLLSERIGEALGDSAGRVLDLACGPGLVLRTIGARSRSVVGLDLTPRNLELARSEASTAALHLVRGLAERS